MLRTTDVQLGKKLSETESKARDSTIYRNGKCSVTEEEGGERLCLRAVLRLEII